MRFVGRFLLLILLSLNSYCEVSTAPAQSRTTTSLSLADVRKAIGNANAGDTVVMPEGSATWDGQLIITKAINLIGAGIDKTIITSRYSSPGGAVLSEAQWLIVYRPADSSKDEPVRLSGFSLDCAGRCYGIFLSNPTTNALTKVRVDHTKITNTTHANCIYGPIYGEADNNEWHGYLVTTIFSLDESIWSKFTFRPGTADNFYFEDNTFYSTGSVANAGWGGRYCFRYNTIIAENHLMSCWDAHGNMGHGNGYSTQGVELYENVINAGKWMVIMFDHRGGRAIVFNNRLNCTVSAGTQIREEYFDSANPPTASPDGEPQYPSGSYYWSNYKNGTILFNPVIVGVLNYGGSIGTVPTENRDFWIHKTAFDGTSGIGVGILSARPQTGTTGVGYWATDVKKLFVWTGSNKWEEYYSPYTYPHPLRNQ